MVVEPLASVLRSGRDVFNAKFAQARRRYPKLDQDRFGAFLIEVIGPIVEELSCRGEALGTWTQSAYDVALELVGERMLESEVKSRAISQAWRTIVPRLSSPVLACGEAALASLTNAVHNLLSVRGARIDGWIAAMGELTPRCETLQHFLQVGQVLAWRSGMTQLRAGALEIAELLPEPVARDALRMRQGSDVSAVLKRMREDVWHDPSVEERADNKGLRPVWRAGAFRGFGGDFASPPVVASSEDQLFVSTGEDVWLMLADVFGYSLHRATRGEFDAAARLAPANDGLRAASRSLSIGGQRCALDLPGTVTSVAVLPHTIAVTSSFTHRVQLVAR